MDTLPEASPASLERALGDALRPGAIRSVFQPIVDLDTGAVVAHEALARGPLGLLERPDHLFAAARAGGRLAELDAACRLAAFRGAVRHELFDPLTVFVNVEPEVLETAPLDDLVAVLAEAAGGLRVVVEITERSITARPAHLLATVERIRSLGWGVALDDVGADTLSLAFMPLLRPDVIKLDISLVQERPGPAVAEIMNAVNAHAERTGAIILAEGIETEAHLKIARALGARLGQGWMFGRPTDTPSTAVPPTPLAFPVPDEVIARDTSPFACLPAGTELRRSPKALLIELSKQLEREALRIGETCVVAATFQEARHFTASTTQRYRDLADRTGFVCALGEGLPETPVEGVRGAELAPGDAVRGEWDVAVIGPHFAAALLARDLGDSGPDAQRTFEFALTYDRDTVAAAARALVARVVPRPAATVPVQRSAATTSPRLLDVLAASATDGSGPAGATSSGEALLHRALAATTSGITISDMRRPDQPLIYVNHAFEVLAGRRLEDILGRNCRFLQGRDTDAGTVTHMRAAIDAGRECTETLLNYRGPDRKPWWNEIHLAPVTDASGTVLQYIGVQSDVTARVEAERALRTERDRAQGYLARIEELANTDPLTGLLNRRRVQELVEAALWEARSNGSAVALVFLDLDRFKPVNDAHGHAVGDELLRTVASRLRTQVRRGDLLARLGGDEFLVALTGLGPERALEDAVRIAGAMSEAVTAPVTLGGTTVVVGASTGTAVSPLDGDGYGALLHVADQRMYALKRRC